MTEHRSQEEIDEANAAIMEDWLFKSQKLQEVQDAAGRFLGEFATFESYSLQAILTELSSDARLIEHLADLMDLENRLRLLKRLMSERTVPPGTTAHLEAIITEAKKLQSARNEIAHGFAAIVSGSVEPGVSPTAAEMLAGVVRPPGRRPLPPEGGFRSQAHLDHHMTQSVRSVDEINSFHQRTMTLNRNARAAWRELHEIMVKRLTATATPSP